MRARGSRKSECLPLVGSLMNASKSFHCLCSSADGVHRYAKRKRDTESVRDSIEGGKWNPELLSTDWSFASDYISHLYTLTILCVASSQATAAIIASLATHIFFVLSSSFVRSLPLFRQADNNKKVNRHHHHIPLHVHATFNGGCSAIHRHLSTRHTIQRWTKNNCSKLNSTVTVWTASAFAPLFCKPWILNDCKCDI